MNKNLNTQAMVTMAAILAALALAWPLSLSAMVYDDLTQLPALQLTNSGSKVCPDGHVATGINGTYPVCAPVTAGCPAGQVMTGLNNAKPQCVTAPVTNTICPVGQVVQGYDASGQPSCTPVVPTTFSAGCPDGQVLQGFTDGVAQCVVQPGAGAGALKFATGTGCGACPNGSFPYPGQGYACNVKDEQGNIRPPTGGTFWICQTLQGQAAAFSFWTY